LGRQFSRLTVTAEAPRAHRKRRWHCSCACGGSTIAYQWSLLAGRSRSCGCLKAEELNARQGHELHGMYKSPEYKAWLLMKRRCYDVHHREYRNYGGVGVIVHEPWRSSFLAFYDDVGPRPSPRHTLRRIRDSEGFGRENCRWILRRSRHRGRELTDLFLDDAGADEAVHQVQGSLKTDTSRVGSIHKGGQSGGGEHLYRDLAWSRGCDRQRCGCV